MRTLHCFGWKLEDIISHMKEFKEAEWDSILLSPVQPKAKPISKEWYEVYQISSLTIEDPLKLKEVCEEAHKYEIKILCDVIFTHFGNDGKFNSLNPANTVDKDITDNKYFWKEKQLINYNNRYSITHHCNGCPSTRTDNFDYIDLVADFLNELIEIGVDGFRVDSCKMISLPEEDGNLCLPRLYSKLNKKVMWFGEVINETSDLMNMYHKYIGTINNLSDSAYRVDKTKELVFVESHDSFLNDDRSGYTKRLSEEDILINWKYLIKDFPNTIFYPRPFSDMWKYANK